MRRAWIALFAVLALGCEEDQNGDFEPLFGDDESLLYQNIGSISLSGSDSKPVVVSIPDGTTSFAMVLTGLGGTVAQPATIKNPSGELVFEVGKISTNRSDAYPHVSTTLVPINPAVSMESGDWEFVFFAGGDTSANIEAVVSKGTGSKVDLNVHLVGLEVLDATSAPDDADFQAVLEAFAGLYSGISVGEVSYFDVTDDRYAVLETTAVGSHELLSLLEDETSDRDNRAINLFFVADIENPSSSRSLLGVSGGVPGPPGLHGTKRSGVAINMANFVAAKEGAGEMSEAIAEASLITAHEVGHYFGLFHTTEANGQELAGINGQDPLDDTPTCPDSADTNGDGVLSSSECADHDGNHLMFWSPPNGASTLSGGQQTVLRSNPVVR